LFLVPLGGVPESEFRAVDAARHRSRRRTARRLRSIGGCDPDSAVEQMCRYVPRIFIQAFNLQWFHTRAPRNPLARKLLI
jgi:hypothetical protein